MSPEITFVLLLAAATTVAIATRFVRVPYTVALVVAGIGLGATRVVPGVHLTKDLLYTVFLPGLLFEAAYHLKIADFRSNARAILVLAVPGVVLAIGATATLLVATGTAAGLGWPAAFVFAAVVAATDPIAVVALFKTLGAPARLGVLIEGESLVNDGTGVVLFTLVLAAASGAETSFLGGMVAFGWVVGAGIAIGAGVGLVSSLASRRIDDPMIEIAITTIAAYGSFAIAEELRVSGIIATVVAGMFCGSAARPGGPSTATQTVVESFWRYIAFAMNSLVFLLIGLEVPTARLLSAWRPILVAFLAVTLARAVVVFLASLLLRPTRERIPWRWSVVLTWGGLRGALSMVLALALPQAFPQRDIIETLTLGVVLVSIVLQGTTTGPLLRKLGLVGGPGPLRDYLARGKARARTDDR